MICHPDPRGDGFRGNKPGQPGGKWGCYPASARVWAFHRFLGENQLPIWIARNLRGPLCPTEFGGELGPEVVGLEVVDGEALVLGPALLPGLSPVSLKGPLSSGEGSSGSGGLAAQLVYFACLWLRNKGKLVGFWWWAGLPSI